MEGKFNQPYYVTTTSDKSLCLAAVYHESECDSGTLFTFSVMTKDSATSPQYDMKKLHDRQPVILTEEYLSEWLDPATDIEALLQKLRVPSSSNPTELIYYPVTSKVGHADYQGADCAEPLSKYQKTLDSFFVSSSPLTNKQESADSLKRKQMDAVETVDLTVEDDKPNEGQCEKKLNSNET
ncbi:unnamed protein product [Sphagnum balticum]